MARRRNVLAYLLRADLAGQLRLLALVCVSVGLSLVPVHLFRLLIDRAIPQRDLRLVWQYGAVLVLVALVKALVDYRQALRAERLRGVLHAKLRADLTGRVLRLGPGFFGMHPVGQIANRVQTEVGRLGFSVPTIFVQPLVEGVTFLFYLAYLLSLNPTLTLVSAAPLPLVVMIAPAANRGLARAAKRIGVSLGRYSAQLQETLSSAFEVQVHGTWRFEEERLARLQDQVADDAVDIVRYGGWLTFVVDLTRFVAPVMVYVYGGALAMRGGMEIGEIVAFAGVLGGLYASLDKLVRVPPNWRTAQDRFEELSELLDLEPAFADGPGAGARGAVGVDLVFEDVSFGYDPNRQVLDEVSLRVAPGDRVAFVGRSGCGKSTALQLASGRLRPGEGRVLLDGVVPADHTLEELTSTVGVAGQTAIVFAGTVRHNLVYALLATGREAPDAELLAVCDRLAFAEDLFDLGLHVKVPAGEADRFLALRRAIAEQVAREPAVERFVPGRFLERAGLAENLLFAPDDDGQIDERELDQWAGACAKAGVAPLCVAVGHAAVQHDLAALREMTPELLKAVGTTPDEVAERVRLDEAARSGPIGGELERVLVRRGLQARVVASEHWEEVVRARERVRAALGPDAPPAYDPDLWNARLGLRDNLLFGHLDPADVSADRRVRALLHEALDRAGLTDEVRRRGLDFDVGERGARLSGGQRQKVALARVLLKRPRLVLLDEVTSALDQVSARQVFDAFTQPDPGCTVVAITHQLGWLDRFDRVVVFEGGRVVEDGPSSLLAGRGGAYAKLAAAVHA